VKQNINVSAVAEHLAQRPAHAGQTLNTEKALFARPIRCSDWFGPL